jgi:hypothetical protein
MNEHDDYTELDLPSEHRPSRIAVGATVVAAIALTIMIVLPLAARLVAARLIWN